jgi:chemotaxis family two-component system sensor kinase Cph1
MNYLPERQRRERPLSLPGPPDHMPTHLESETSPLSDERLMFAFAHDTRTHLRTILTRLQLTQATPADLAERELGFLGEAAKAATEIEQLLNSMTTYCSVVPAQDLMGLRLMLRGLLLELKEELADSSVEISGDVDLPVPTSLTAVFRELIRNSCRFRREDRKVNLVITLSVEPDPPSPDMLHAVVTDNGLGVDTAYLDKIFEPFQRLQPRHKYPGHGLGLAICRRVVTRHGGEIRAHNNPEGGLAVQVSVPVNGH